MSGLLLLLALVEAFLCFKGQGVEGTTVVVRNSAEFRSAVLNAKPGGKILLAPGEYEGGLFFQNVKGEPNKPIVIDALDPANPPIVRGGGECLHFSDAAYLEIRNLVLTGARYNALNIDDGGTFETPSHHIKLVGLKVRDVGPHGNCDGIKLSGVTDFRVEGCTVERWGMEGKGLTWSAATTESLKVAPSSLRTTRATASKPKAEVQTLSSGGAGLNMQVQGRCKLAAAPGCNFSDPR